MPARGCYHLIALQAATHLDARSEHPGKQVVADLVGLRLARLEGTPEHGARLGALVQCSADGAFCVLVHDEVQTTYKHKQQDSYGDHGRHDR